MSAPPVTSQEMLQHKLTQKDQPNGCSYEGICLKGDTDQQASSVPVGSMFVNDFGIVTFAAFIAEKLG